MTSSLISKPWDSQLFGYPIGQTSTCETSALRGALTQAREQAYRLVYGIFEGGNHPSSSICADFGGRHVDTKVAFGKPVSVAAAPDIKTGSVALPLSPEDQACIQALALQSGEYSRFRTDPQMNHQEFEKLYDIWIKKSLEREIASDVLVVRRNAHEILGMVTYQIAGELVEIGLIGIDHSARGQGLGRQLMQHVDFLATQQGCTHLRVATQRANSPACAFYHRIGCTVAEEKEIYHFWL